MRAAIALMSLAFLAACNDGGTVERKNASTAEVAKSVADAGMKLNPGRWELTMQFKKFEVEGMPPEAKAAMQKMLGETRTFASCLTKEEAEKPDGKFFGQQGEDCKYDTFTMGNGKIDATMTCKGTGEDAGNMAKMTLAGTYSPDTYDMTMDMNGTAPNGKQMVMQMALTSKHKGECKGDEQG